MAKILRRLGVIGLGGGGGVTNPLTADLDVDTFKIKSTTSSLAFEATSNSANVTFKAGSAGSRGSHLFKDSQSVIEDLSILASAVDSGWVYDILGGGRVHRFKTNGSTRLSIGDSNIIHTLNLKPSTDGTISLGNVGAHYNSIFANYFRNTGDGGTLFVEVGSATTRGSIILLDSEAVRSAFKFAKAIDNTTDQTGIAYQSTQISATDILTPSNSATLTLATSATGHKISPNWIKAVYVSGTYTSDVTVNIGVTGNTTKYASGVALFGSIPGADVCKLINISNQDFVSDLIVTVTPAGGATGTNPRLRFITSFEEKENE